METKPTTEGAGANPAWAPVSTVERVAERLGSADARTIYGDPVERNGTTVIPVAKVRFGFGGGAGRKLSAGEGDGELLETLTALRDDGYTGFASLEPHLTDVNSLGGFSGPREFGRAARAFSALTAQIGVGLV